MAGLVNMDPAKRVRQFADLERKLVQLGFKLHPLHDDTLLVERWGISRVLADLAAAERFLSQVGGARA